MLYEITNPSDPYTMRSDHHLSAQLAALLLGQGAYTVEPLEEAGQDLPKMPFLMMGGDDALKAWLAEVAPGRTLGELVDEHRPTIAAALSSVMIGYSGDRWLIERITTHVDPAELDKILDEYHDRRRSSMNDIGGRARQLGRRLAGVVATPAEAATAPPADGGGRGDA